MTRSPQLELLNKKNKPYGGSLRNTRQGRSQARPLATKHTIHLVLRSSKAKGTWSFLYKDNPKKIKNILHKFGKRYGVQIVSAANVGNHLHVQIKLFKIHMWKPFIRAITGAIAMAITGASRWKKIAEAKNFWDYRPFTRIVTGFKAYLALKDYIELNKWEGFGFDRATARTIVAVSKVGERYWNST